MGILNRTPDSFFDRGATWDFDAFLANAEQLVADGADFLDVGGVKAGPGPEVTEAEELDRVVPAVEALTPASTSRSRSTPGGRRWLAPAIAAGAVVGNDICGFADPDYLAGGRRSRRVGGGHPHPPGASGPRPRARLRRRRRRGLRTSSPTGPAGPWPPASRAERIMVDAGLDLGKTEPQSLRSCCARSDDLVGLGYPAVPVGVEQALPRRAARHRGRRPPRGQPWPPTPSASPRAAASCGPTTSAAPGAWPT